MAIDLEERLDVYTAAYNKFQELEADGFDRNETYASVEEAYDRHVLSFVRGCLEEPHAEEVDLGGTRSTTIDVKQVYELMEKYIRLAFGDVFGLGKERFESVINELEDET